MIKSKNLIDYSTLDEDTRKKKAKAYLLWILARRDYPRQTLESKLKERKLLTNEIEELIEELINDNFYKPDAFFIYRIRTLSEEGYSEFGIKNKLYKQGHRIEQSELKEIIQSERIDLNRCKETFFKKCIKKYGLNQDSRKQFKEKLVHRAIKKIESRGYRQTDLWDAIEAWGES